MFKIKYKLKINDVCFWLEIFYFNNIKFYIWNIVGCLYSKKI